MKPADRFTCEETFRRLDDYLDRSLSPPELQLVEAHLHQCEVCASEYRFESSVVHEVRGKLRRIRAPHELVERITSRLQNTS